MNKYIIFTVCLLCCTVVCRGQDKFMLFDETQEIIDLRKEVINGSVPAQYQSKIKNILADSEEALQSRLPSVTYKKSLPISGNKHDYYTLAPYFWPDSSKRDGLPWIRKDGQVNPLTRVDDYVEKGKLFKYINALALAYYFSDSTKYAVRANEIIHAWFIDEKLKMNPHLDYGQAIPGVNSGRPFGLIEWAGFSAVLKSVQLLEKYGQLDKDVKKGLDIWIDQFLVWMRTGKIALEEDNTKNNHSTYFDHTLTSLYLYRNDVANAKKRLEKVKSERLKEQIRIDGSMPHELARTKSLSYTNMNTRGFLNLCYLGKKLNIDIYNYGGNDFGSVKDVIKYLESFALGKKWTFPQISEFPNSNLIQTLAFAYEKLEDKDLEKSLTKLSYKRNIIDLNF